MIKLIVANRGRKKWSKMTKHFVGRTENSVKNRYKILFEKVKRKVIDEVENANDSDEYQILKDYLQI